MVQVKQAEYIWLDGRVPTQDLDLRRVIKDLGDSAGISNFQEWSYDDSSTYQADGGNSTDWIPVNFIADRIRGEGNFLVLCEVMNEDGTPYFESSCKIKRDSIQRCNRPRCMVWF